MRLQCKSVKGESYGAGEAAFRKVHKAALESCLHSKFNERHEGFKQ